VLLSMGHFSAAEQRPVMTVKMNSRQW
jgi:hypothetical protein